MGIISRIALKNIFKTGNKPAQKDFADMVDSLMHKQDIIAIDKIDGLTEKLEGGMTAADKETILTALETQETAWQDLKDQTVLKYNDSELTVASDSIVLADAYSGVEHLWRTAAGTVEDGVLGKKINGTLRKRQFEVADVRWWGVTDGPNQGSKLQKALDDIASSDVRELAFFGLKEIQIEKPLVVKKGDLKIDGKNCVLSASSDFAVWNLDNKNSVWITNFISGNTTDKQTWLKATSSHHLRLTDCRFDGMKLGIDLTDCYYTKINAVRFQSVHQAFQFKEATNGFSVTNTNIHGAGIPSLISRTTTGGRICGCGFEDASGRLVLERVFGIDISGNYFEGYNEEKVDTYIQLGTTANYTDVAGISIHGNLFYTGVVQAIKMSNVGGISIKGNYCNALHFVNLVGDGGCTQRNIDYSANFWAYLPSLQVGIPESQAKEVVGEFDGRQTANISPEFRTAVIFQPEIFHSRRLEDNAHHVGATPVSAGLNALVHRWKVGGVESSAYLNGSVELCGRNFAAGEAFQTPFESFGVGCTTGILIVRDGAGKSAQFVWCRNINSATRTGAFREVYNELGISVTNPEGVIKIVNGGTANYLLAEFKL